MVKREITKELLLSSKKYPVVTITGPRQSGKTTLVKKVFPKYAYYSLEDPDVRELALSDPRAFLRNAGKGIIIDEIQKAPQMLSYIQGIVDSSKKNGRFILTGSQNFQLMHSVTQSLAGRTALLCLLPFTFKELSDIKKNISMDELLFQGFYPRIYDQKLDPSKAYKAYYQTYVERDLRALINIKDVRLFQKFTRLCAGRVGQIFNASALASEVGVSVPTINSWLSILQESYIVFLLEPYHSNINKRLIKSPKIYFYDTGLASYLLGIDNVAQMARDPLRGNLVENMVIMEMIKHRFNQGVDHNLYFYRDNHQNEVDVIFKAGSNLLPIEIKSSETFNVDFLKGLSYIKSVFPKNITRQVLIYGGDKEQLGKEQIILNYRHSAEVFSI